MGDKEITISIIIFNKYSDSAHSDDGMEYNLKARNKKINIIL